jgi:hypothetical protein
MLGVSYCFVCGGKEKIGEPKKKLGVFRYRMGGGQRGEVVSVPLPSDIVGGRYAHLCEGLEMVGVRKERRTRAGGY